MSTSISAVIREKVASQKSTKLQEKEYSKATKQVIAPQLRQHFINFTTISLFTILTLRLSKSGLIVNTNLHSSKGPFAKKANKHTQKSTYKNKKTQNPK